MPEKQTVKSAGVKKPAEVKAPSPDKLETEIRAAAQALYEDRVKKHLPGDANSDWVAAETRIKKKYKL